MMAGYAFHVGLFHSLLFAGFHRRFHNVPNYGTPVKIRGQPLHSSIPPQSNPQSAGTALFLFNQKKRLN